MSLFSLPSIVKYFCIILCSLYFYIKVLGLQISKKTFSFSLLFLLFASPLMSIIKATFPLYVVPITTLFITLFFCIYFKNSLPHALCLSILSTGISYVLFTASLILSSPITYLLFSIGLSDYSIASLILPLIGILQNVLVHFLFKIKRLRDGIPYLASICSNKIIFYIGTLLLLFSSFFFTNTTLNPVFDQLLISFIFALGGIIWLWWQKSIQTDYINKNNFQQIDILESKLQERDAELERLSKIIHKDNKLLAALELSTRELLTATASEKAQSLLQELNRFSKERSEALHAYESGSAALPETRLFSVDTMIRYLHQRALKHKIEFQLNLEGELAGITDVICEQDLCTIIADLGENAIIATRESEIKNIRLSMERKPDGYALYFYDSGEPFAKEVLENLGKKRYTTHAETGGSGIGLMTTSELVTKYHGEFYITDAEIPEPYTKCVVVKLLIP